jgi:hypothetical protein
MEAGNRTNGLIMRQCWNSDVPEKIILTRHLVLQRFGSAVDEIHRRRKGLTPLELPGTFPSEKQSERHISDLQYHIAICWRSSSYRSRSDEEAALGGRTLKLTRSGVRANEGISMSGDQHEW